MKHSLIIKNGYAYWENELPGDTEKKGTGQEGLEKSSEKSGYAEGLDFVQTCPYTTLSHAASDFAGKVAEAEDDGGLENPSYEILARDPLLGRYFADSLPEEEASDDDGCLTDTAAAWLRGWIKAVTAASTEIDLLLSPYASGMSGKLVSGETLARMRAERDVLDRTEEDQSAAEEKASRERGYEMGLAFVKSNAYEALRYADESFVIGEGEDGALESVPYDLLAGDSRLGSFFAELLPEETFTDNDGHLTKAAAAVLDGWKKAVEDALKKITTMDNPYALKADQQEDAPFPENVISRLRREMEDFMNNAKEEGFQEGLDFVRCFRYEAISYAASDFVEQMEEEASRWGALPYSVLAEDEHLGTYFSGLLPSDEGADSDGYLTEAASAWFDGWKRAVAEAFSEVEMLLNPYVDKSSVSPKLVPGAVLERLRKEKNEIAKEKGREQAELEKVAEDKGFKEGVRFVLYHPYKLVRRANGAFARRLAKEDDTWENVPYYVLVDDRLLGGYFNDVLPEDENADDDGRLTDTAAAWLAGWRKALGLAISKV